MKLLHRLPHEFIKGGFHCRKAVAPLKPRHRSGHRHNLPGFHCRKAVAPLKRYESLPAAKHQSGFHCRKAVAPLKEGGDTGHLEWHRDVSIAERRWLETALFTAPAGQSAAAPRPWRGSQHQILQALHQVVGDVDLGAPFHLVPHHLQPGLLGVGTPSPTPWPPTQPSNGGSTAPLS